MHLAGDYTITLVNLAPHTAAEHSDARIPADLQSRHDH
jgi:hypothetical protein